MCPTPKLHAGFRPRRRSGFRPYPVSSGQPGADCGSPSRQTQGCSEVTLVWPLLIYQPRGSGCRLTHGGPNTSLLREGSGHNHRGDVSPRVFVAHLPLGCFPSVSEMSPSAPVGDGSADWGRAPSWQIPCQGQDTKGTGIRYPCKLSLLSPNYDCNLFF